MSDDERASRIVDVARLAGVSAMTVSRVLNNRVGVSPTTRERVLTAAGDLRYRANRSARSLRLGQAERVVLLAHPLSWSPQADLIGALERAVRRNGSELEIVLTSDLESENPFSPDVADLPFSAAIALDPDTDHTGPGPVPAGRAAVVVTTGPTDAFPVPTWSTRDDLAARLATAHLVELGHRRIAHLAGPSSSVRAKVRHLGWLQMLSESGLEPGPVVRGDWSAESGELAVAALMADTDTPTAIFVADDLMAVGTLKHLHRMGVGVPDDVAVVGFGDMPGARSLIPGLTTVRQDVETLAAEVVQALFERPTDPSAPVRTEVPHLVIRESTVGLGRRADQLMGA